jgi:hypothetical protein
MQPPNFTDVSKRPINWDLYSVQELWQNICTLANVDAVHIGSIVELQLAISQAWQQ